MAKEPKAASDGDATRSTDEQGAALGSPFNGADPAKFDHDRDGHAGGSVAEKTTYLVARTTDGYGPRGSFTDLTEDEASAGKTSGVLVIPTPEQLALRRR